MIIASGEHVKSRTLNAPLVNHQLLVFNLQLLDFAGRYTRIGKRRDSGVGQRRSHRAARRCAPPTWKSMLRRRREAYAGQSEVTAPRELWQRESRRKLIRVQADLRRGSRPWHGQFSDSRPG